MPNCDIQGYENGRKRCQLVCGRNQNGVFALYDHTSGIVVNGTVITGASVADVDFMPHAMLASVAPPKPLLIVAHIIDRKATLDAILGESRECKTEAIFLQVSRQDGGISAEPKTEDSVVWLTMKDRDAYKRVDLWLSKFLCLSFADARELEMARSREGIRTELEMRYAPLLDIILPRTIENRLALRLLCEAWQMTGGAESKVLNGVTISAPHKFSHWLAPFGEDKPESVAALMGEAKTDASKLLAAVAKGQKEGIATLVDTFITRERGKNLVSVGASS